MPIWFLFICLYVGGHVVQVGKANICTSVNAWPMVTKEQIYIKKKLLLVDSKVHNTPNRLYLLTFLPTTACIVMTGAWGVTGTEWDFFCLFAGTGVWTTLLWWELDCVPPVCLDCLHKLRNVKNHNDHIAVITEVDIDVHFTKWKCFWMIPYSTDSLLFRNPLLKSTRCSLSEICNSFLSSVIRLSFSYKSQHNVS